MGQGAGNFMIVLEQLSVLPLTMDRINKISASADARILFSSASELDDRQEASLLLAQIDEKLGSLEAVFFVGIVSTLRYSSIFSTQLTAIWYIIYVCRKTRAIRFRI